MAIRFVESDRELRLDPDVLAALGNPAYISLVPFLGGLIIAAATEGQETPKARKVNQANLRIKLGTPAIAALGLRGRYYDWTRDGEGRVLAMPESD